jgi:hypothetical protein
VGVGALPGGETVTVNDTDWPYVEVEAVEPTATVAEPGVTVSVPVPKLAAGKSYYAGMK